MEAQNKQELEQQHWLPEEEVILPHECEHTPDSLRMIDEANKGDTIEHYYLCECGKIVVEIFTLVGRKIVEA